MADQTPTEPFPKAAARNSFDLLRLAELSKELPTGHAVDASQALMRAVIFLGAAVNHYAKVGDEKDTEVPKQESSAEKDDWEDKTAIERLKYIRSKVHKMRRDNESYLFNFPPTNNFEAICRTHVWAFLTEAEGWLTMGIDVLTPVKKGPKDE